MTDPYPGATRCLYISCPICGMNRPINKKGSAATMKGKVLTKGVKGLQHFNKVDVNIHQVIHERACLGPPRGFPKVRGLLLRELKSDPNLRWVREELIQQCKEILHELCESEE